MYAYGYSSKINISLEQDWKYKISEGKYLVSLFKKSTTYVCVEIIENYRADINEYLSSDSWFEIRFETRQEAEKFYQECDPIGTYAMCEVLES